MSEIDFICKPAAFKARTAASLPKPGPLIKTSRDFIPLPEISSATTFTLVVAANGVDLRVPLNPAVPALPHETTKPLGSVIVITVLLNVECTYALPCEGTTIFFFFRFCF